MIVQPLTEEELNSIYNWVDQIPLSRPKRNIARDFSDGLLVAEIIAYFLPQMIDMHNYSPANSVKQKRYNWDTLNQKVFRKLGFTLTKQQTDSVVQCEPEAIERVLIFIQQKIDAYLDRLENNSPTKSQKQQGLGGIGRNRMDPNNNQMSQQQQNELWQKEQTITELRETIEVLEAKLNKMDELMKQKDMKIQRFQQILMQNGLL